MKLYTVSILIALISRAELTGWFFRLQLTINVDTFDE